MKGVDVLIKIDNKILGGQRGASLDRSVNAIETTTKLSNEWAEKISGIKEWSIDCDGLLVPDDEAFTLLESAFVDGEEVDVALSLPGGTNYTGKAIITSFPLEAPYDDSVTYSVTLEGTGPLTKTIN